MVEKTVEDLSDRYDLVLVGVAGSKVYGLDTPDSDTDYAGVFQLESKSFLGLDSPSETVTNTNLWHPGTPDYTYQELGKFCRLALGGNPTVLETLWLPKYITKNDVGDTLVQLRQEFLSSRVKDSFGGYAKQQLERLKRNGTSPSRGEKYIRHMFRLLREGKHLITTGDLQIHVADREELFKMGKLPVPQVVEQFNMEYDDFVATDSILPDRPNKSLINEFVIEARLSSLPPDPSYVDKIENLKEALRTTRRMLGIPGKGFR